MSHSRFQTARKLLIFWTFFIGLGAVAGAAAMLIDPSGRALGMAAMLLVAEHAVHARRVGNNSAATGD